MHTTTGHAEVGSAHPEMAFLLACVHRRFSPAARFPDPGGIHWDRWIELAMRHRVLPIAYAQLANAAAVIPDAVRARLKDLYFSNTARNMGRVEEMRRLAGLFESQGVPVMFLRGPVLASTLYRDLSLRQFTDLDLLVHEQDVPRMSSILAAEGYQPHFQLDVLQEQALIRFRTERCFIRSEDQSTVDLHWRLLPGYFSFEADEAALWSRSVMVSVEAANVRTLGDEDLFLYLCAHGAKHGWDQLALLSDLAEMIRAGGKRDWARLMARANSRGKRRMVAVALELLREMFGLSVPDAGNEDRAVRQLVKDLKARLEEGVGVQEGGGGAKWSLAWRMMERGRDRLAYAVDLMVVPTGIECERMKLPRRLFFLYYLLRLGRMVGKVFSRRSDRQES